MQTGNSIPALLNGLLGGASTSPEAVSAVLTTLVGAVPIPVAQALLGGKARSQIYAAQAKGLLEFQKDGNKTLVTLSSIFAYRARYKPFNAAQARATALQLRRKRRRPSQRRAEAAGEPTSPS